MEDKLLRLIEEKGPLTGSEILETLRGTSLALWKTCCLSARLQVRVLGSRYLRLDRRVEGFARLSPSILREFMTYTVVGLAGNAEALDRRADAIIGHIREVSRAKLALAQRIVGDLQNRLAERWPREGRVCFIIAGDIVYDMAHDVPRPEQSIGEMVNGSDIDLVVVSDDGISEGFLKELDAAIYKEKYYTLIAPSVREEIDYVVKNMERVREQMLFDTFKRMVACKILQEGMLLAGSRPLFDEIKGMLTARGVTAKLKEMEAEAGTFRRNAREYLLNTDSSRISRDDLNLFYTTEESEEFE
ncbi:hypothetical protein [Syntrophobacter fumaroxidans]|uniref:Uncharacterized protein n=1 Tax=Syntrophobacter fumaroxidans (strain DSM 10017 / MPOB) TaxID=335543 RepID=A0LMD6_SYNFM|nr:hypothetical protein [Syntrophobacter fumaroxidans]ABK18588.1 conserved hypothetical protein [Syntrophobacter fumaroxidans MPOB]